MIEYLKDLQNKDIYLYPPPEVINIFGSKKYNLTLNPSAISGSTSSGEKNGIPYGFVTESYFSPYITTVGLYDEAQNLLAIGKLAQPLPSSPTTDTTILINLDR